MLVEEKHADDGVRGGGARLLDAADGDGPHHPENQHAQQIIAQPQHNAQTDARQGAVPQGIGEKSHLLLHRHGAQQPQQGRQQQDGQKGVFHKTELERFQGQHRVQHRIDAFHQPSASSPVPNTAENSGVANTSAGLPWASTVLSSSTT